MSVSNGLLERGLTENNMDIEKIGIAAGLWTTDGFCVTVTKEIATLFANMVAEEEREACALLCMTFDDTHEANRGHGPEMCAEAIRKRSND
jgi:hypothetical protein